MATRSWVWVREGIRINPVLAQGPALSVGDVEMMKSSQGRAAGLHAPPGIADWATTVARSYV